MSVLAYLRSLGGRFFCRSRVEEELAEEIRFHIQCRADDLERVGLARAEAERRARIEFGSGERFKEECRESIGGNLFEALLRDLRYGMRMLAKNPAFTLMSVATLALGIGANTAVFSAFNSLLLRPLPFEAPDRLVRIYSTKNGAPVQVTGNPGGPSQLDARDFAQDNHTFEKIVSYNTWRKNVSYNSGAEPEQMRVGLVPAGYFEILRISPLLGRLFSDDENQFGRHYVAAIDRRLGAWGAQRLLSGFLFQVSPVDPITFGGGALFLLVIAALASFIPAARALRIEPSQLLRRE